MELIRRPHIELPPVQCLYGKAALISLTKGFNLVLDFIKQTVIIMFK